MNVLLEWGNITLHIRLKEVEAQISRTLKNIEM